MTEHSTGDIHNQVVEDHYHESSTGLIWRTFWILLIITVTEVGLAFTSVPKSVLKYVYILLTLVKAYFIVFYFMHLKFERPQFARVIILPFFLIAYLITLALSEGTALKDLTAYIASF